MSFVKKQNSSKVSDALKNISHQLPFLDLQNKTDKNTRKSLINENVQTTEITNPKPIISSKMNKQKEMLKNQHKLVKNKQVRAVPGEKSLLNYT